MLVNGAMETIWDHEPPWGELESKPCGSGYLCALKTNTQKSRGEKEGRELDNEITTCIYFYICSNYQIYLAR